MVVFIAVLYLAFVGFFHVSASPKCPEPYSHCNLGKEGFVNVHLVPHTHDDVGWLKTVDQYYYGSNNANQEASVQYILDTVIIELEKDPSKRFVYVEMAFFWRWWNEQNDGTKQLVRTFVNEGRLEFVIGAWCMNDEATTYYNDIIDQQWLGLKFILKEFGECARPRSAWQIDPFGHSREQASLFAQFGFDGLFLGRVDYQDFEQRGASKSREMLWQASENLGEAARLFTGVLPYGYNPPPGFCFDVYCGDDPIMDDPNLDEYNVDAKVDAFIEYTQNQASQYSTSNLIMTLGSDFQYSNAHMWFKNVDKLIYHVNRRQTSTGSKINIFYSTPACYLYSLHEANATWSVKRDDFFPYAHRPHAFWTGYFTSRAALKGYVRRANNFLQIVRQLAAVSGLSNASDFAAIGVLERAMGVAQHHDAVSGTEKQHVAYDYAKRLAKGVNLGVEVINKALRQLVDGMGVGDSQVEFCPLLNISQCSPIEDSRRFVVILYNPLPRPLKHLVRVPTVSPDYSVYELEKSEEVLADFVPIYPEVKNIPERNSSANFDLVFDANLSPLGFKTFIVEKVNSKKIKIARKLKKQTKLRGDFSFENEYLKLTFDSNGNLKQMDNLDSRVSSPVSQVYCVYNSMPGNNSEGEFQASGAYVFRPDSNDCEILTVRKYSTVHGSLFDEIHQTFNEWISQTIRLFKNRRNVEVDWLIGPIDVEADKIGREVVIKFQTNLASNSVFYTDSNGREILKRVRNYRPTWALNQTEPIAGNYYPVNSQIYIRDEEAPRQTGAQFTIVTDRSQGGSSLNDGSIEIMLHRRTLYDDALGVSEPLNELGIDKKGLIVKGSLYLMLNTSENSARVHRDLAHLVNYQPLTLLVPNDDELHRSKIQHLETKTKSEFALPANLHLLTLMRDFDCDIENSYLIRIEHFYEIGEDSELSNPVTVDLRELLADRFNIIGVKELALGANMAVEELGERLEWNAKTDLHFSKYEYREFEKSAEVKRENVDEFVFTFEPMQIRTFRFWTV